MKININKLIFLIEAMSERINIRLLSHEEREDLIEQMGYIPNDLKLLKEIVENIAIEEALLEKNFIHTFAKMNTCLVDLIADFRAIHDVLTVTAKRYNGYADQKEALDAYTSEKNDA